jgi:hypothetical protein
MNTALKRMFANRDEPRCFGFDPRPVHHLPLRLQITEG